MLIIFLTISLSHKHPHELLDSVVKERWVDSFVSTEARILHAQPQRVYQKFSNSSANSSTYTKKSLGLLVGGRQIVQD